VNVTSPAKSGVSLSAGSQPAALVPQPTKAAVNIPIPSQSPANRRTPPLQMQSAANVYCGILGANLTDIRTLADHLTIAIGTVSRALNSKAGGCAFGAQIAAMKHPPTAALICSEIATVGFYGAMANAGLQIGRDISVVVFRDNPQVRALQPPPACFHADLSQLGQSLAQMVVDLVKDPNGAAREANKIWPMTFISGGWLDLCFALWVKTFCRVPPRSTATISTKPAYRQNACWADFQGVGEQQKA
jgi:hypothetical protein